MADIHPIRILYMEDDLFLARLVQKKLSQAGYMVDLAYDGAEGLAKFSADTYDLVAVDQEMPIFQGLDVIRSLAQEGGLPPTIMITGKGDENVAVEAMKLGASDYVVKDLEGRYLELLPSVIEHALHRQRLIHDKRIAEDALRESEEKYRSLFEAVTDTIFIIDKETGQILDVNHAAESMYGFTREELIHVHTTDLALDNETPLEGVDVSGSELPVIVQRKKDGNVFPVEVSGSNLSLKGRAVAIRTARDITERKRAQDELETSLAILRAVLESTADGTVVVDTKNTILMYDRKYEEMWKLPKGWLTMLNNDEQLALLAKKMVDPDGFLKRVSELMENPDVEGYDLLKLSDGRYFERYTAPYRVGENLAGRVWSFRDISYRKQMQDE